MSKIKYGSSGSSRTPEKNLENIYKNPIKNEYEGNNLISTINALDPKLVLDLGCGYNKYKGLIKGVVGVDANNMFVNGTSVADINDTILNIYNDGIFEDSSVDAIICFGCGTLGQGGEIGGELLSEKEHQELEAIRNWSKNGAIIAMRGWTPWCDKIDKISSIYDFKFIKEPVISEKIYTPPPVGDCPPDVRYCRWHQLNSNFPDGTKLSKFVGKRPIDIYEYFVKNRFSGNALRINWWWRVQK
jgi:hypothetical protein